MSSTIQRLALSTHFELSHEYEEVWLTRQGVRLARVGDFYGDPNVAIIDADERWCAIGGSGLIVYFLEAPFHPYEYGVQTTQYLEVGREKDSTWWVEAIHQTGASEIQVLLETGARHTVVFQRTAEGRSFVVT